MKRRHYRAWLYLVGANRPNYWYWLHWQPLGALLSPLISSLESPAYVYPITGYGGNEFHGDVLPWMEEDMKKWTFVSPLTANVSDQWRFITTRIWSPSKEICFQTENPPDFVFGITYVEPLVNVPTLMSQIVLFAIADDLYEEKLDLITATRLELEKYLQPAYAAELNTGYVFRKDQKFGGVDTIGEEPHRFFFRPSWNAGVKPQKNLLDLDGAAFTVINEIVFPHGSD